MIQWQWSWFDFTRWISIGIFKSLEVILKRGRRKFKMPEASKKMRAREWSTIVLIASVHALIGLINLMRMQWLKELINLLSTAMQCNERERERGNLNCSWRVFMACQQTIFWLCSLIESMLAVVPYRRNWIKLRLICLRIFFLFNEREILTTFFRF